MHTLHSGHCDSNLACACLEAVIMYPYDVIILSQPERLPQVYCLSIRAGGLMI